MNLEDVRQSILSFQKSGHQLPCTICKNLTSGIGVWIPDEDTAKRLGAPSAKTRLFLYPICEECRAIESNIDEIERRTIKAFIVQ